MSSRTWAARPRRSRPIATRRRPTSSCSRRARQKELLLAQLDELSQYCDAGTKVIMIGKVNDIVLYRQLMARGVSEYLVWPFGVFEFVSGHLASFQRPQRQAGRARGVGDRRQGRRRRLDDRPQSRLAVRLRARHRRRSSPISISASARRASTSTRIRRKASPRRCSRRNASIPTSSIACCRNAARI